ncbi:isochorismatase family protein [Clostridium beijerinckii]|uniref:Nicotinamidase-related amidase n=1 Tax=Clostridium beijerinckii TaxID=1520 RepID=A0AAE5H5U2_CLOBE|nr:isochorismatase family protein [Clostridium beijerinckii]NSB14516.1 nicotinamidase-related amidase [Clostridium beijerinckii]OOM27603.1 isochorismatase family protein YecD [Clostridium beijerinckii]
MEDLKLNEKELIKAETSALVLIDLQKGIAGGGISGSPHSIDQVIQNASKLVKEFSEKGAFIVLVRVSTVDGKDMAKPKTDLAPSGMKYQEGWDELIPEIAGGKNAHIVTKRQWGAFYGTDLDLQLRRRGIDTIVLGGISTNIGVDTTAREAFQHGYNQIFVEDAMTAISKEEHEYVCKYIFPRIGKIRTSEQVISLLK